MHVPMWQAINNSLPQTLELLLEAKAEPNRKSPQGLPPHWRVVRGAVLSGETALHHAASMRYVACVEALIKQGARLRQDVYGYTPLHSALTRSRSDLGVSRFDDAVCLDLLRP